MALPATFQGASHDHRPHRRERQDKPAAEDRECGEVECHAEL